MLLRLCIRLLSPSKTSLLVLCGRPELALRCLTRRTPPSRPLLFTPHPYGSSAMTCQTLGEGRSVRGRLSSASSCVRHFCQIEKEPLPSRLYLAASCTLVIADLGAVCPHKFRAWTTLFRPRQASRVAPHVQYQAQTRPKS